MLEIQTEMPRVWELDLGEEIWAEDKTLKVQSELIDFKDLILKMIQRTV